VHKEPFYGYSDVSLPYPYPTRSSATAERPHDAPCPLKSLQQLHSCTRNHIWKAYSRNDIGGDSRSSELPLLDRSYVTSYKSYVVTNNDSIWHRFRDITTITVYMTGWLWPWEVFHFRTDSCNYKPRALSDSCVNISKIKHTVFQVVC